MGTNGAATSTDPTVDAAALRAAASTLVERYEFASRHGLTFQNARDLARALGYKQKLVAADYWNRYERGGLASTIVTAYPEATWRGGATLIEDEDPAVTTDFERAWQQLAERLRVWEMFLRADILAGLGRYAVILIGAPGELSQEMPQITNPEQVAVLSVFGEKDVEFDEIKDLESNPADPRYGMPIRYRIQLAKGKKPVVHWSRMIHIADGLLADDVYGLPRLQKVWNRLDDLDKVIGAGAEAFWQRAQPGNHIKVPAEMKFDEADARGIEEQFDEFQHGLRRYFLTQGVEVEQFPVSVAGMRDPADAILTLIAGATKIPKRMLTGSERGELASSQDRSNFERRARDRREQYAEPRMVRPFVGRLIEYGALPEPSEYRVVWPSIRDLDERERMELAAKAAEVNRRHGAEVISRDEIRDLYLDLVPFEEVASGSVGARAAQEFERTEEPPQEPSWKAIHRAADDNVDAVASVVASALESVREALDVEALEGALGSADRSGAVGIARAAVGAMTQQQEAIAQALLGTLIAGGNAAAGVLNRATNLRAAQAQMVFDEDNPKAVLWAESRAAALIQEETAGISITTATLVALREEISAALSQGVPPGEAARQIRQVVGLTSGQAQAVATLREELLGADPGSLVTRFGPREGVRETAGFRARIPEAGATEEWIETRLAQYRGMQLNLRARTIARTETIAASNAGQQQLWEQARDSGLLRADQQRQWSDTSDERVCVECEAMDGQRARIGQPYGNGVIGPPLHASCRCAEILVLEGRDG